MDILLLLRRYKYQIIMKKIGITLCVALAALIIGCQQKEEFPITFERNRLIAEKTDGKTSNSYVLFVLVGHDAKGCPGCTQVGGKLVHVPCHSHGSVCRKSSNITLQTNGFDLTATTTDTFGLTSEDFFVMPDRSLNYTDENNNRIFLNIPAQQVYRDSVTQQFTFTGLFFSNTAAYSNL